MRGLMLHDTPCKANEILWVDGSQVGFSLGHEGTQVSAHTFHAMLGSHRNSWEIMAISRALGISASRETSSLTGSFQR